MLVILSLFVLWWSSYGLCWFPFITLIWPGRCGCVLVCVCVCLYACVHVRANMSKCMLLCIGICPCRRARPTDPAVFSCISLLSRAIGDALYADMKVSLENMLAGSLTPPLTACLQTMANKIPNLCKDIQGERLPVCQRACMCGLVDGYVRACVGLCVKRGGGGVKSHAPCIFFLKIRCTTYRSNDFSRATRTV